MINAKTFSGMVEARARSLGMPELRRLVTETEVSGIEPDAVERLLEGSIGALIPLCTEPLPVRHAESGARSTLLHFSGIDRLDAWGAMNRHFLREEWSDGFPLVAPTPEAVEKMLSGTRRRRDEVVVFFEPHKGTATVEKIAINAVMAGCEPAHLPVLLTAIECIHEPAYNAVIALTSTGPHTPFLIVNGPIVKELGINSGLATLGPGAQSWVNTVIGRALRLCILNVGHCYPGRGDADTIGSPTKYSMVAGENESMNPWEPFHVERGFRPGDSTVTAFSCESQIEVAEYFNTDPVVILRMFAHTANSAGAGTPRYWLENSQDWHNILIMCPEHAHHLAKAGYTKMDIRQYLYQNARLPWAIIRDSIEEARISPGLRWMMQLPDDWSAPIAREPRQFDIVVVGGPVGKSSYVPGNGAPVTRRIEA